MINKNHDRRWRLYTINRFKQYESFCSMLTNEQMANELIDQIGIIRFKQYESFCSMLTNEQMANELIDQIGINRFKQYESSAPC